MKISLFKNIVWDYYAQHKRVLPWRKKNTTPYQILVSEIMLQQTQVDRVIPKYKAFIKQFPNFKTLAKAQQKDVLTLWQGLGYNRRALNLKKTAEIIWQKYHGHIPRDTSELMSLPGIGPYTAQALRAFVWNIPTVVIETNIRAVFIYHFFPKGGKVFDKELIPLIEKTLDTKNPRTWYSGLMDYGTHLKKTCPNPSRKSAHHTQQTRFEGSHRQVRGDILKYLLQKPMTKHALILKTKKAPDAVTRALDDLSKEHFIQKRQRMYCVRT
jgi:A/G-specific adenine glycosylase